MSRTHFTSIIDFLFERVWIDNSSSSSKTPDLIVEQEEKNIVIVENKEKELNNFEENEKENIQKMEIVKNKLLKYGVN